MERRKLGKTDLKLPVISYGASSLGQEFRRISIDEALQSCRVAIDLGMNFIDTSPFYGRGMSEVLLGQVLRDVPRDSYTLGTKLGRYDLQHFDFSANGENLQSNCGAYELLFWDDHSFPSFYLETVEPFLPSVNDHFYLYILLFLQLLVQIYPIFCKLL